MMVVGGNVPISDIVTLGIISFFVVQVPTKQETPSKNLQRLSSGASLLTQWLRSTRLRADRRRSRAGQIEFDRAYNNRFSIFSRNRMSLPEMK
jgi:hypothetical protein